VAVTVWVFDVDGTLIDSLSGTSLRPGAEALLTGLRAAGRQAVLWSAGGTGYARDRAAEHGIEHLFHLFAEKGERDADGRYLPTFLDGCDTAVFVDDRPEDMPVAAAVITVSPYIADNPHDRGLATALGRSDVRAP
jgi:long-chain acyl-CoA synthetase